MGRYLNPGNEGFQTIRNSLYVDKSEMISFINSTIGTVDKLTCVSRPRRFGKSFAVKMLCAYYDKSCDSRALFQDLEIAKTPDFNKHLNQYHVICFDVTWFISTVDYIKNTVKYLQKEIIAELAQEFLNINKNYTSLSVALSDISVNTGCKFIVIIDEWDALFREAKDDIDLQKEYIQFLRGLFKSSETDKMIEAAYMTGILPIKKYGTQSALTDFIEYTMLQPGPLAKYVGFTQEEVKTLCEKYDMDFNEAKHWYDGYSFRKINSVYSPNSVVKAMKIGEYDTYWTQTETYESLKIYIEMDKDGLKESIVQMLGGASVKIDIGTFQNDMTTMKQKDDVLTLLVHLGYLAYDARNKAVYIPNEEVRQEFIRVVSTGKHDELAKLILESEQLLKNTINMDTEAVALAIEKAHTVGTTPLFYNDEQALRSVIRFAYISCIDEFLRIEELPTGIGYADVVYLPKNGSTMPIMIVELKWNQSAQSAIDQIKNRDYPQVLEGFGNEILLVGINYDKKSKKHTCKIEKFRRNENA
jgi:hypothetical protein